MVYMFVMQEFHCLENVRILSLENIITRFMSDTTFYVYGELEYWNSHCLWRVVWWCLLKGASQPPSSEQMSWWGLEICLETHTCVYRSVRAQTHSKLHVHAPQCTHVNHHGMQRNECLFYFHFCPRVIIQLKKLQQSLVLELTM